MGEVTSLVKHQTVIRMLDGAIWRGTIETAGKDPVSAVEPGRLFGDDERFYFESCDGGQNGMIKMDSVKAIYVSDEVDSELHTGMRFFDSAPIPRSLWVRAAFPDGEIVEGMIANAWSAFNSPLIQLHLPGQALDQREVLIPRTSIAELQVITTR
jgi:hypothetical protein